MQNARLEERIGAARIEVSRAVSLLESPSPKSLEETAMVLERVVGELAAPGDWPAAAPGSAGREAARQLRTEVQRAGRLLQAAAAYFENWNRRLGAITGGYIGNGEPAAVNRRGHLSLEG